MEPSTLDALNIPILLIDNNYNIVFANKDAKKRFKNPTATKCYAANFNFDKPCWQYENLKCPLKEILENGKDTCLVLNEIEQNHQKRKYLIKVSTVEKNKLYTEVIIDYNELITKKRGENPLKLDKTTLKKLIQKLLGEGKLFYISSITIKNLKKINQFFGIEVGDSIIASIEEVISKFSQKYGLFYTSITGAHFIVVNPNEQELAFAIENKLFEQINKVQQIFHMPIKPIISIVSAEISPLITKKADEVLKIVSYADKFNYDEGILYLDGEKIDEILSSLGLKSRVITTLEEILDQNLIDLFFQPIVSLKTGEVDHFEALIRIKKGEQYIPIGNYIDLIYELNLITDFNLKVLDKLVEYLPILKKTRKKVFVNVSSIDLKKLNFRQKLIETIITFQNEGLDLGIELTEQAVFEDYEFLEFLNQGLGIKFAIDDFGTGYSSLKMVIDLFSKGLISAIKLDCTLVKSYFESEGARALITSIVEFTKMFNLETIAECVETKEHVDTLRKLGVTHGQGWYFYKALPVWELPEVAKKQVKL